MATTMEVIGAFIGAIFAAHGSAANAAPTASVCPGTAPAEAVWRSPNPPPPSTRQRNIAIRPNFDTDIRLVFRKSVAAAYTDVSLNCWSKAGDPVASFYRGMKRVSMPLEDLHREAPAALAKAAVMFSAEARPRPCPRFKAEARAFFGCDVGLAEAFYAVGVICTNSPQALSECAQPAEVWFRKAIQGGYRPAIIGIPVPASIPIPAR